MNNRRPKNAYYIQIIQGILFVSLLTAFFFAMISGRLLNYPEAYPVIDLNEGWQLSRNGEEPIETALKGYVTGDYPKGETFTLTRTLPNDTVHPSGCIYFRNLHAAVTVLIDGEELYTSGIEKYKKGLMVGRLLCYVPLPEDYSGKELTISIEATRDDAFYGLGPVYFGTEQDLYAHFFKERQIGFYIAIFLCVFGMIQIFWIPLLLREDRSALKLFCSAITTFVLGVYLMGYYNLFDLFTDIENANTMLEYLSLYLVPLVMSGFICTIMEGRMKKIYRIFLIFDIIFVITALVLHFLNIVHFVSWLMVAYAISFSEATPFLISIFRGWTRHRTDYYDRIEEAADRVLAAGFFAYVIGSFIDAGIFTYVRMTGGQEATVTVPFVTMASLLYSMAVSMHYFLYGVVNLRQESTRETLRGRAYSDPLTGLSNRAECEMVLSSLSTTYSRYIIISMDLDRLKQVNDTHGHAEGDRMLTGFSAILQECFKDVTLVGRMGGDEFIVVLTEDDCDRMDALLENMQAMIGEANEKEEVFSYSVSYGTATNADKALGRRAHDIYMLADERMYNMKRKTHGERRILPEYGGSL